MIVLLLIGSLERKEKTEQFPKQGCPHRKGGQLHAVALNSTSAVELYTHTPTAGVADFPRNYPLPRSGFSTRYEGDALTLCTYQYSNPFFLIIAFPS